jgi:hypothetical protein
MQTELTNLIPLAQTKAFRRDYWIRLITVLVVLLLIIMLIEIVLLVPSYLYERGQVEAHQQELNKLSANSASAEEQQVQESLTNLKTEAAYLLSVDKIPEASTALRAVLAVPHPGITLSSFTFAPGTSAADRSLQISGIADTREDLRSFDTALSALPYVTGADLPISVYAKENAIPFTIAITGSLTP